MLLKEFFAPASEKSPIVPYEDEIDWIDDLKFYIDNDDATLKNYFFPAVDRHKEYRGNPNAYKVYIRPLERCKESYCEKFEIQDPETKFPKEKIIELAKRIASEQEKFMEKGDYETP